MLFSVCIVWFIIFYYIFYRVTKCINSSKCFDVYMVALRMVSLAVVHKHFKNMWIIWSSESGLMNMSSSLQTQNLYQQLKSSQSSQLPKRAGGGLLPHSVLIAFQLRLMKLQLNSVIAPHKTQFACHVDGIYNLPHWVTGAQNLQRTKNTSLVGPAVTYIISVQGPLIIWED